uniref:Dol-P-Man:Man(5)GlcNAc(2)-PP-Dol alpha-1,3-mannosyltransferase n=2 Tax=Schizophyllum commune (strain H4-8 / FGSC 9210) TaxID=578458 RepID=D8PK11_SCHCM
MVVKHLPPAVKQLLTLRNPQSLPSPPLSTLNNVLKRTFQDAKTKKAETGWLVLSTCSLLTTNRLATLGQLYRFVTRADPNDAKTRYGDLARAVNRAALMREAAIKSTIFVGVPRVILSLAAWHEALDEDVKASLRTESRRTPTPYNIEAILSRGQGLWNSIYTPHAEKLYSKLGGYHPDFIAFIITSYGALLSPMPGQVRSFHDESGKDDVDQGNLSRAMGSIVGTACLRAEGGVGPQLTSHVFGLLKARDVEGLTEEDKWLASDEGTAWVIRTVDDILDAASSGDQIPSKM